MNMKPIAPFPFLCRGVQNGGGGVSSFKSPEPTFTQEREDEMDGYTDETDGIIEVCQHSDCEKLEKETRELLTQFYLTYTGLPVNSARNRAYRALPSLHRVVGNVLDKHRFAYNGMVQQLFEKANGLDSVNSVLHGVFSDGVISWGRIASVLALGAIVCERLMQDRVTEQKEDSIDIVTFHISSYLGRYLQPWLINNNGWDGFVEFFRVEDPESTVRSTLMAVAGLGIAACLIILMR